MYLSKQILRSAFAATLMTFAPAAFAADINTYRAGNTYLKSGAGSPNMCEAQCTGDAQCKGWNFLRSGSPDGSGICEFNSQIFSQVQHPYAISGEASGYGYSGGSLVQGQTNTRRIGEPLTVRPQAQFKPAAVVSASTNAAPRPVTNMPAVQTRQRTFAPQAQQRVQARVETQRQTSQAKPATLGGPLHLVRPLNSAPQTRLQSPLIAPALSLTEQQQRQIAGPAAQPTVQNVQRTNDLPQAAQQFTPQMQAQNQMQPRATMTADASSNLYGSLYDDVPAKRESVKLPLYNERPTQDPKAPVATTAVAVPTAPVYEAPLSMAGAAPKAQ